MKRGTEQAAAETKSEDRRRADHYRRQLEAVFNNATFALFVLDDHQHCTYMNPAAEKLTGFTLEEVQGRPLHNVIHHTRPDGSHYPVEECPIDRAFPENNQEQGEEFFVRKDGYFYPVAYTASPIRDQNGIVGTVLEVRDLTEEKRAEQALELSEERFRTLTTSHTSIVWIADSTGALREAPLWEDYAGQPPEESRGWGWLSCVHPDDRETVREIWKQAVEEKTPAEFAYRLWHREGAYRYVEVEATPLLEESGEVREWVGTITDTHERKEAQEVLREAHLLSEMALSAGGVVAWVWDIRGDRLKGSESFARLFSVDPQGASQGLPLEAFVEAIHEDDRSWVLKEVERAVETGEAYSADYRVRNVEGQIRWVAVRGRVEYDAEGNPIKFPGVLVDITERKRAEQLLAKANETLEQRVRERTAELEALNKELDSFNYSVSHDLRTPLRGIDGFSQALLVDYSHQLDETGQQYLQRIRSGAGRMGQLIEDLLDLSRFSTSQMKRQHLDLSELVEALVAELRMEEPERQVEVRVQAGITAEGDKGLTRVILHNLLRNAWKFTRTRETARIEFGMNEWAGEKVYFVRDNGVGFDMQYADKLFVPFQRLHSPGEHPGTGVGLALVSRIVRRHEGRVWAEAEEGRGAVFYFTLCP